MNDCKNAGFMNAKQLTIPIVNSDPSLLPGHLVQRAEEIHIAEERLVL